MYIQGVSPYPAARTLTPPDVETNLEDEDLSDNEDSDNAPHQPIIPGIMLTYLELVTVRLKKELRYYIRPWHVSSCNPSCHSPMCFPVTQPFVLHLFSTRSVTDTWLLLHLKTHDWWLHSTQVLWFCKKMSESCKQTMETQHHTKSTFLESTEPDYFRDVQVVLDCTGFYFFVSPILETIYTLTYSVISGITNDNITSRCVRP